MRSHWYLAVLVLLCSTAAEASTISLLGGPVVNLLPNTAGQQIVVLISGTDFYSQVDLRTSINGGVHSAPRVTAVFDDPSGSIPTANLAGSVWAGSTISGTYLAPNGPAGDGLSSGLQTWAGFATPDFIPQDTAGIFAVLTVSTADYSVELVHGDPPVDFTISPGQYTLSFEGTVLYYGLDENFEEVISPLQFDAVTLNVLPVPEPSTYALTAMGMVGLLVNGRRRGKH
jgi:hypothetical protein